MWRGQQVKLVGSFNKKSYDPATKQGKSAAFSCKPTGFREDLMHNVTPPPPHQSSDTVGPGDVLIVEGDFRVINRWCEQDICTIIF